MPLWVVFHSPCQTLDSLLLGNMHFRKLLVRFFLFMPNNQPALNFENLFVLKHQYKMQSVEQAF